jgi:chromosome partitioning protein
MGKILAFANQKGGVGKTTTAVNIGAYLANVGQRVLIADIDPQANATSSLGINKRDVPCSMYDALVNGVALEQAIVLTGMLRLDLIPSSPALAGAEVELVEAEQREYLLRQALAPVADRYDYILIDSPPSLGLLTINALTAARDGVVIPVQCEYLALEGLSQLIQTIELVRSKLNPALQVRGVVMTMYDGRTRLSQQVVDEVRKYFGARVFATVIPRSIRLGEAPSFGQPVLTYAPLSAGAMAYESLAQELMRATGQ